MRTNNGGEYVDGDFFDILQAIEYYKQFFCPVYTLVEWCGKADEQDSPGENKGYAEYTGVAKSF